MKILATAIVAILAASAANAVTVTSLAGAPDPGIGVGESLVVSFDGPNAAGYTWSAGTIVTTFGTTGAAASPSTDMTNYGYVSSALSPDFATLSTPNLRTISLYWGSIDTYNFIDVLGPGNAVLTTIGGAMLPPANGDQGSGITNRRVFITAGAGETITGLTFRSTGVAFEFDTIGAAAVPEPQSWALMVVGFGLVGLAARRRHGAAISA